MRGPLGSQVDMETPHGSSMGPSYRVSVRYFCATAGEGRWRQIISSRASEAGSHLRITVLTRGLSTRSFSSEVSCTLHMLMSLVYFSFLPSMMSLNILKMGSSTNLQKPRTQVFSSVSFLDHLPDLVSKKLLPHIFFISL